MSAPRLQSYALPEYEPPLHALPPDPDPPVVGWAPPPPVVLEPPENRPVWDEPGPERDQFHRLLCLVVEVLNGRRPITQLRGATTGPVYDALMTRCRFTPNRLHRLRTLRTCRPAPDTIELCATVLVSVPSRHPTVITLAARMEHRCGRWLCTVLRPLYPNPRKHR